MEIDFNFVCVEIDLISVWKIELDLIPVQDGIDLFGHCVWVDANDFISVWWIRIDLIFV